MLLGKNCTRNCRFCNVTNNLPEPVDSHEAERVAQAVRLLGLDYVTITSVTRDDLEDGGTESFLRAIEEIKNFSLRCTIEVLIPDMKGDKNLIRQISESSADVIGHNIEIVKRLYPLIRPQADYRRSLNVLKTAGLYTNNFTKSAIMLGLGEEQKEVIEALKDIRETGTDIVYIGQYLRPTMRHFPVARYYTPAEFKEIGDIAIGLGFKAVSSGPLVRSSYHAKDTYLKAKKIGTTIKDNLH